MNYFKPTSAQIIAFVQRHFPDNKPRKGGQELRFNNPFNDDEGMHFSVNTETGRVGDWRGNEWAGPANPKGKRPCTFLNFVRLYLGCSFREAIKAIVSNAGDIPTLQTKREQLEQAEQEKPLVTLPVGSESLVESKQKMAAGIVLSWLATRGIDAKKAALYGLYHSGTDVVFPYYEYDRLVYWQTRSLLNKTFRFPDEKEFGVTKGQFIYNFDNVEPASYIIVTEAIFGCLTLGDQAVATGGADMTETQARKMKLFGPHDGVVLAPDNDQAGIKSITRNAGLLRQWMLPVYYSLPPSLPYLEDGTTRYIKDWNEMFTKLRMSFKDIRAVYEHNVKIYDEKAKCFLIGLANQPKSNLPTLLARISASQK